VKRCTLYLVMFLSVSFGLLPRTSSADEKITGRIVLHYAKMETVEVGDIPGHILGVAQQVGLVLYSAGGVAKKTATFTVDLLKGKGTFSEYSVITDHDGSTLFSKAVGTAGPVDDGKKSSSKQKSNASAAREGMRDSKEPALSQENVSAT